MSEANTKRSFGLGIKKNYIYKYNELENEQEENEQKENEQKENEQEENL